MISNEQAAKFLDEAPDDAYYWDDEIESRMDAELIRVMRIYQTIEEEETQWQHLTVQ